MEQKDLLIGHETTYIIIAGLILSLILAAIDPDRAKDMVITNELFMELFLPLIVFATGFNMRREKFFAHFVSIAKFGLVGTLVCFFTEGLLCLLVFNFKSIFGGDWELTYYDPIKEQSFPFHLNTLQVFYVCSILCSSDIVAAVTILDFEQ